MPFINIRIVAGRSQEQKDEITRRIVEAVSEVAEISPDSVWVVFEDVSASDWFVGERSVQTINLDRV